MAKPYKGHPEAGFIKPVAARSVLDGTAPRGCCNTREPTGAKGRRPVMPSSTRSPGINSCNYYDSSVKGYKGQK
jgi:hypothetical protein